ncbi:MAG: hypothetical protein CVU07_11140, partial [Bacteroidetes bacterium HGW-Bacteroidetes-23]
MDAVEAIELLHDEEILVRFVEIMLFEVFAHLIQDGYQVSPFPALAAGGRRRLLPIVDQTLGQQGYAVEAGDEPPVYGDVLIGQPGREPDIQGPQAFGSHQPGPSERR